MEARLLLAFIVVSVLLDVCRAEFCYSYTRVVDGNRVRVPGFSCPKNTERPEDNQNSYQNVFCCGPSDNKYCCNDCRESQNGRACLRLYSSTVSVGAIIGITMGSTFVGLGCIYFGCCMFYTLFPRKTAVGSRPGSFQQNTLSNANARKSSCENSPSITKLLAINNGHVSNGHRSSIDKPAKVNGCPGSEPLLSSCPGSEPLLSSPPDGSVEDPGCEPVEDPGCESVEDPGCENKSKVVIVVDCPSPSHSTSKETVIDFPATNSEASESRKASIESAV
ncbi:uncharacterized protein LOC144914416 [Branchiostoma floridae x Branchiostoma belcheri]